MRNKKGQVAIFVIVGIVIVVGILIYFMLRGSDLEDGSLSSNRENIEKMDSQVSGIYMYVDSYLSNVIEDGLEILRLQGGYIYIPLGTETVSVETEDKHVVVSDGVPKLVIGTGRTNIPLWIGKDSIAVPSKQFMEDQLNKYIEDKIPGINLEEFEERGIELDVGEFDASISFEENTIIDINYPINSFYGEKSYSFEDYSYLFAINFNDIYDMASGLAIYEIGYQYLEEHAKSLMSLYAYSGEYKRAYSLPPHSFTETNTNCNFVTWNPLEVKNSLRGIFAKNYPFLKIGGTDFERVTSDDKSFQGTYDSFVYDFYTDKENMNVDISYDLYNDLSVKTNPSVLIPDRTAQSDIPFLPMFCSFDYKFSYTIDMPIVFKISDKNSVSPSSGSYDFYFPIQMYICNDKARSCNEIIEYSIDEEAVEEVFDIKLYDCQDVDREYSISVSGEDGALSDADITHKCEGYDNSCWLGRTQNGVVSVNIPKCTNSTIMVTKQGYQSGSGVLKDSYYLDKLKDYDLDVKLIRAEDFAKAYYLTEGFTHDSCSKSIEFYEAEFTYDTAEKDNVVISISGDSLLFSNWPLEKEIRLAAGNYEINTIVNSEVKIFPSYFGGELVGFNSQKPEEPYEGTWLLGATNYKVNIDPSETANANKVTLYALVERVSTEELEANDFMDNLIQDSGIAGEISVDSDCDGSEEIVSVNIPKSEYTKFIKPRFS